MTNAAKLLTLTTLTRQPMSITVDSLSFGRGFKSHHRKMPSTTPMHNLPLSSNSEIWYWCSTAGKITGDLAESNDSQPSVGIMTSHQQAGCLETSISCWPNASLQATVHTETQQGNIQHGCNEHSDIKTFVKKNVAKCVINPTIIFAHWVM